MSLLDILQSIFAQRLRAALTILGIVIGTGSIILLASLIEGGGDYLATANQGISDDDVVTVKTKRPSPKDADRTTRALSRTDAEAIAAAHPESLVAAESKRSAFAEHDHERRRIAIVSASASTLELYRLHVAIGRELGPDDRGHQVCVVGEAVHRELLKGAPLTDLHMDVEGHLFSVVGVLERKAAMGGSDDPSWSWNGKVLVPESTYDTLYSPAHEVESIYARKASRGGITSILLERHLGIVNFELSKDDAGGMGALIMKIIHALLLSTGVLALVASGINIMNVMLVTVSERTREIGIRRALGAPPRTILMQFLLEAAMLSLVGALIGALAGSALAWGVALGARAGVGKWHFAIPAWSYAAGIGLALVMGVLFGFLPAWRASKVSPIDALRSD